MELLIPLLVIGFYLLMISAAISLIVIHRQIAESQKQIAQHLSLLVTEIRYLNPNQNR